VRISYAIIFVSDMARSVSFYRDVLGMALKFETPEWTEFATEGATLALHRAHGRQESGTPERIDAGQCRPGLRVPDLDAFHRRMLAHNVVCTQEPKLQFGVRLAQYVDPDGLHFSVSEGS
jgi:lactoylglutathione lyase